MRAIEVMQRMADNQESFDYENLEYCNRDENFHYLTGEKGGEFYEIRVGRYCDEDNAFEVCQRLQGGNDWYFVDYI